MPRPQPRRTGNPHTAVEVFLVDDAIQAKNIVKMVNATKVAHRTCFVTAQYSPTNKDATRHATKVIAKRTPTIRLSVS
jgi:hypothetical protein